MVGVFQAHSVALDGLHHLVNGSILGYDIVFQAFGHVFQPHAFSLGNALHGHTGHYGHNIRHHIFRNLLTLSIVSPLPIVLQLTQFLFKFGLSVTITCSQLKVLTAYSMLLLLFHIADFLFFVRDLSRYRSMLQMDSCPYLIHHINGFVGKSSVGNIPICQFDTCLKSLV